MPRNDLKAFTSLIARLPQELADQVKRYASEHRCTISELIRDGLEMRLDTDLPWHAPGRSPDTVKEVLHEVLPYGNQVLPGHTSALQAAPGGGRTEVVQGHTEVIPSRSTARSTRRGMTEVLPAPGAPVLARSKGMTEVVPLSAPKQRGRKPVLRPGILALLGEHIEGLTAADLKVYLGTEKPIGDTLAGMVKAQLLVKVGSGQAVRYQRADGAGKDTR